MPERVMDHNFRVSVIMVSFMSGPVLLKALKHALKDPDIYELILVDNGNPQSFRQELDQFVRKYDKMRVLQGHGNIGFSKGCNYGASMASGDYLLFLNPDALINPLAVSKLLQASALLQAPWIVGGKLLDIHGQEQRGSRRRPLTPLRAFATFTGLHKVLGVKPIHMEKEPLPTEPIAMSTVSGAFMMLDRASFDILGGFDERYFLHVEDIAICRKAHLKGGGVVFVPDATVVHYGSTSEAPRLKVEWEKTKGFIIYFVRYSDRWWAKLLALVTAPAIILAIMGRACWITLKSRRSAGK